MRYFFQCTDVNYHTVFRFFISIFGLHYEIWKLKRNNCSRPFHSVLFVEFVELFMDFFFVDLLGKNEFGPDYIIHASFRRIEYLWIRFLGRSWRFRCFSKNLGIVPLYWQCSFGFPLFHIWWAGKMYYFQRVVRKNCYGKAGEKTAVATTIFRMTILNQFGFRNGVLAAKKYSLGSIV